jgi:hypothetical protein
LRVNAYRFSERQEAESARSAVLETTEISSAEVADFADGGAVVGMRATENSVPAVARILEDHGGKPLVDIDDALTGRAGFTD